MALEDSFNELEQMLRSKSTDYERMQVALQNIRQAHEIARFLGPAQDNLYASIARGHRKALVHLEAGETAAAVCEMAGAVSWFLRRFQGVESESLNNLAKLPRVVEELEAARELAKHSQALREALSQSYDIHGI